MTESTTAPRRRRRLSVRGSIMAVGAAGMAAAIAVGGFALSGLGTAGDTDLQDRFTVPAIPGALVLLVGGLLASWIFDLGAYGVALVGHVPRGLPAPAFPDVQVFQDNYVTNRCSPEELERLLDNPELVHALGQDAISSARAAR